MLVGGVQKVINKVSSDEGPSINWVIRNLLEVLLMHIGMSGWRYLSSLKLHCVDKLSTSIVPSVNPFCYTSLIKVWDLLYPRPLLIISTAVKHAPTS